VFTLQKMNPGFTLEESVQFVAKKFNNLDYYKRELDIMNQINKSWFLLIKIIKFIYSKTD
jgi:hypothetical protein